MMVIRDHLVRHPDRCTHQAICVPICPTGAWLSTPPYKFDPSRCLESCRLCLDACPSQAIYAVFKKGEKVAGAAKEDEGSLAVPFARATPNERCRGRQTFSESTIQISAYLLTDLLQVARA